MGNKVQMLSFYEAALDSFPAWTAKIPNLQDLKMQGVSRDWNVPEGFRALQHLVIYSSDLRQVMTSHIPEAFPHPCECKCQCQGLPGVLNTPILLYPIMGMSSHFVAVTVTPCDDDFI